MPLLPSSITESVWVEFAALIGVSARPEFSPDHPWGCHRRRVPNRVVFDHVIAALVHGSGYERIASPGLLGPHHPSPTRRLGRARRRSTPAADNVRGYDHMIGFDLDDLSVDGAITKSPAGARSRPHPVDRGKQGTKRSVATDGEGIPLQLVAAAANDHDWPLLEPTLTGIWR